MLIQESLQRLESNKSETGIYFKGQIYDAYSKLLDILSKSKNEIIIIIIKVKSNSFFNDFITHH